METFLHDISWVVPLRSAFLTPIFEGFTLLGYTQFFLVFLPLGYWLWDKKMFTRLAILIGIVGISNSFLKDLFHDPRPPLAIRARSRASANRSACRPATRKSRPRCGCGSPMRSSVRGPGPLPSSSSFGVCFSRLYLGVHDVEDVLGGTLLGLAIDRNLSRLALGRVQVLARAESRTAASGDRGAGTVRFGSIWPRDIVPIGIFGLIVFIFGWWIGRVIEATLDQLRTPRKLALRRCRRGCRRRDHVRALQSRSATNSTRWAYRSSRRYHCNSASSRST